MRIETEVEEMIASLEGGHGPGSSEAATLLRRLLADLAAFLTPTWKEDDSAEPVARRARTIARQGMKAWCNRPVSPEQVAVCNKLTELIMDALAAAEARALAAEAEVARLSKLPVIADYIEVRARVERAEAALRGAVTAIEWWEREHPCCRGATDDLLEAARAALTHTGE